MPFNFPGVLAPFQVIFRPRLIIPSLIISGTLFDSLRVFLPWPGDETDIRTLNFAALYEAGYRGAVFDKDNCLVRDILMTIMNQSNSKIFVDPPSWRLPCTWLEGALDSSSPDLLSFCTLQEAWDECKSVFGKGNVIVVSNTAGTSYDDGGIQVCNTFEYSKCLGLIVFTGRVRVSSSWSCGPSARFSQAVIFMCTIHTKVLFFTTWANTRLSADCSWRPHFHGCSPR